MWGETATFPPPSTSGVSDGTVSTALSNQSPKHQHCAGTRGKTCSTHLLNTLRSAPSSSKTTITRLGRSAFHTPQQSTAIDSLQQSTAVSAYARERREKGTRFAEEYFTFSTYITFTYSNTSIFMLLLPGRLRVPT